MLTFHDTDNVRRRGALYPGYLVHCGYQFVQVLTGPDQSQCEDIERAYANPEKKPLGHFLDLAPIYLDFDDDVRLMTDL